MLSRIAKRLLWGVTASFLVSCGYRAAVPGRAVVCIPFVQNETPQVGLAGALTQELRRRFAISGSRVESTKSGCSSAGVVIAVRLQRADRSSAHMATRGGHLVEVDGLIELEALVTVSEVGQSRRFVVSVSELVPRAGSAPGEDLVTSARSQALTEVLAREIERRVEVW